MRLVNILQFLSVGMFAKMKIWQRLILSQVFGRDQEQTNFVIISSVEWTLSFFQKTNKEGCMYSVYSLLWIICGQDVISLYAWTGYINILSTLPHLW